MMSVWAISKMYKVMLFVVSIRVCLLLGPKLDPYLLKVVKDDKGWSFGEIFDGITGDCVGGISAAERAVAASEGAKRILRMRAKKTKRSKRNCNLAVQMKFVHCKGSLCTVREVVLVKMNPV